MARKKKVENILDKIESSKEVLATMPKNNPKNINAYKEKLNELKEEYEGYQKDIYNKLKKKYQNSTKKNPNKEISNLETRLKTVKQIVDLFDEEKTSYEKMELDKSIYSISRYYKDNLENINEQIRICLERFSNVGIQIRLDDFDYSIYVKKYMRVFMQELEKKNLNSNSLKESFEEIYWKCPDIIVHIELNLRNIYLKNQNIIDKYYEKEKMEKAKQFEISLSKAQKTYMELRKDYFDKLQIDQDLIKERFLSGELNPKNYTKEKIDSEIQKILPKDVLGKVDKDIEIQENISKFLNSLYEYRNYMKFKFIIDDMKKYYNDRTNYKKSYQNTKNEVSKLEKNLYKLNKKATKGGLFGTKKVEYKQTGEMKELIQKIKDKYKELDTNKFLTEISLQLNDNSTLYDMLKLADSYYIYLTSCIIKNFDDIVQDDIDKKINELHMYLENPYNTIINHVLINENEDLSVIIKDRYKLLKFNVEKEDLEERSIGQLITRLETIQMSINMKKANLKIEDIDQLCEIKKIIK